MFEEFTRRRFMKLTAMVSGAALLGSDALRAAGPDGSDPGWAEVPKILSRIKPPVFPSRDFDLTQYGGAGDGVKDCTAAFKQAIEACHQAGGGRVVVPPGIYLTGAIYLKSKVNLHVSKGATVRFSQNPQHYLPAVHTRWEGVELMNYSPFIYAYKEQDLAISGEGILDGQSDCEHWWPWKGRTNCGWKKGDPEQSAARKRLFEAAEKGVPVAERVFGNGDYLRPQFIQPYLCQNVLIEGVTIRNSPMWEVHPVLCSNVTIRKINIVTHGPNNDGCDPESCRDVLIEDCYFDTGDDCIAIKSGRNADGRRIAIPSENIVIRRCQMKDGHGGVTIGSEISGGARNIFAEDCLMDSPNLERALRFKTNSVRGGTIENIYFRAITVGEVSDAVLSVDFFYEEGDAGNNVPVVRNIEVRDLTSKKSDYALFLRGYRYAPISGIRIINCSFENAAKENLIADVKSLTMKGVKINGKEV
ncbi:MAG TPA: glycoside hydrolase family 28 protein [Blastocatellia bacterium]|nr:glycoside hydrolase family 28 protein [Blastocatellia bacterium]